MRILGQNPEEPPLLICDHELNSQEKEISRTKSLLKVSGNPLPVLLDFRCSTDFENNHFPGALNYPLKSLKKSYKSPYEDSKVLEEQWLELEAVFGDRDTETWKDFQGRLVVLVCYGGDTARVASSVLRARGVEAVSIKGGMKKIMNEIATSRPA
jgi:rhodanese-related sulfurtransferase